MKELKQMNSQVVLSNYFESMIGKIPSSHKAHVKKQISDLSQVRFILR